MNVKDCSFFKRIICLSILSLLCVCLLPAQMPGWQWVQGGGGGGFPGSSPNNPAPDYVYGSALDKDDNLIVGGVTSWSSAFDTIQFGTGTNWNNANFFLAKYDKCGNILWARVGGGDSNDYIEGLDVDDAGNIYVLGTLSAAGNACYINTPLKDTILYNCTRFFAKFDANGNLIYIRTYTDNVFFEENMFKRLRNGLLLGVIIKGIGNTSFENFQIGSNTHNFVLFDSLGSVVKVAVIDTVRHQNVDLGNIVVDESDNIYFSLYNTTVSPANFLSRLYDPAPQQTQYLFKTDTTFVVKADNTTGYLQSSLAYLSYSNGYLYSASRNRNGAIFDGDTTHTNLGAGRFTAYKIDTNLNRVWVSRPSVQSVSPSYTMLLPGASKDNLYLAYQHRGSVVWDSASLNPGSGNYKMAMLRLRTSDGVCIKGEFSSGVVNSNDRFDIVQTDQSGNGYFIGTYASRIGISTDSVTAQGGVNSPDFFILKWGLPCTDTLNSLDRPDAPANLVATATGTQTIQVTWADAAEYEQGYRIYRSPDGVSNWQQVGTTGNNVTVYNDGNLLPATTYWYRAAAYNAVGESAFTNIDSATTFSGQCSAVISHTQVDSLYTFSVATTGTPSYNYQWSVNGNNVSTGATAQIVLDAAGTYNVCVSVTDANQCLSNSCETITITGIEDWNTLNVALFPNPANEQLYLNIDAPEEFDADVVISDMMGRVILQRSVQVVAGSNTLNINCSNWTAGRYNVKLVSGSGGVWSKGVVKY